MPNKIKITTKYLIFHIGSLFDKLVDVRWFTKLGLRSGNYQFQIAEEDVLKTTCVTNYGFFKFLIISFNLTNAPAIFYNLVN